MIQIYRQDHRGVFAPSFVELDVSELAGIAASLGSLEDEVAENKSVISKTNGNLRPPAQFFPNTDLPSGE